MLTIKGIKPLYDFTFPFFSLIFDSKLQFKLHFLLNSLSTNDDTVIIITMMEQKYNNLGNIYSIDVKKR